MNEPRRVSEVAATFAMNAGWGSKATHPRPTHVGPRLVDVRRLKMTELFYEYDVDGSGTITKAELARALTMLGKMNADDIEELMDEADRNKDGVIDIEEFLSWLLPDSSESAVLLEYGVALRPLFDVFDRNKNGSICLSEFEECHCILQASLNLNPTTEEDHPVDPMGLKVEARDAFAKLDKNSDNSLGFSEFTKYMSGVIASSGVTQEDLAAIVRKLAVALQTVFRGMRSAERGEIKEDEAFILADMVAKLAEATREFEAVLAHEKEGCAEGSQTKWTRPPTGLTISALKTEHMACMPLNMRLVESFTFDVLCVPKPEEYSDAEKRKWVAEVVRTITQKGGQARKEQATYYYFDTFDHEWRPLDRDTFVTQDFLDILRTLNKGLGMLCIFMTYGDYEHELAWQEVKRGLVMGVDIGWITTDERLKFKSYIEAKVGEELPTKTAAAVEAFLAKDFKMRPRLVMATLSKLKIIEPSHTWSSFLANA
eukprot:TRINITY_DN46690_c0_g1_i1.p1 TRINITY_DN46690_c0_g1~~TRINITY_DN46690_c0_g1_i1.p1  ORF type:complete len:485 (+),score=82.54 TRINITY_DN46690_c0_g1_i1:86-1540(+)